MAAIVLARTKLDGFDIFLEKEEDVISCLVTHGSYCSSLGVAEDFGTLEGKDGSTFPIEQSTCAKIRQWAEERGY